MTDSCSARRHHRYAASLTQARPTRHLPRMRQRPHHRARDDADRRHAGPTSRPATPASTAAGATRAEELQFADVIARATKHKV